MSSALRAKMLNELTGKHVLSRLQVGKFFDKGEIRIERRHWDQTFNNALVQAAKKEKERLIRQEDKINKLSPKKE